MAALKQIGDIQIFAEISQGALTTVYKGYQHHLQRLVLLKVLRPEFNHDDKLTRRFAKEARLIAKIQHPNVVTIYDQGHSEHFIYFATEYVEGFSLHQLLERGKLPPELAGFILLEAAKGLQAAHDKNILHKDIKPSNILISHEGQVKLTDFGMAALHESHEEEDSQEVSGTLSYMAPEQILGNEISTYSDIFSLGATFFEMLSGRAAFPGATPNDSFKTILNSDPTEFLKYRNDIPETLRRICKRMLKKTPRERYPNCKELIKDLQSEISSASIFVYGKQLRRYLQDPRSYTPHTITSDQLAQKPSREQLGNPLLPGLLIVTLLILGYIGFSSHNKPENPALRNHPDPVATVQITTEKDETALPKSVVSAEDSVPSDIPATTNGKTKHTKVGTNALTIKETQFVEKLSDDLQISGASDSPQSELKTGYLKVVCAPWAYVFLNGDSLGQTPLNEPIRVGKHDLVLRNPEFPNHKTAIEIAADRTTDLEVSLWSLVGTLKIDVSPWAQVYIDGEYQDTVPPQARPLILAPGKHALELKHPGLGSWQTEIDVKAGEPLDLKFNLRNLLATK